MRSFHPLASALAGALIGSSCLAQSIGLSFVEGDGPGGGVPLQPAASARAASELAQSFTRAARLPRAR